MAVDTQAVTVNPSEEVIRFAGLEIRFLATGEDSNGSASVFEFTVPAGMKIPGPPHFNENYEELVYGLEGRLTWTIDGQDIEVAPGQVVCIRRGQSHTWRNDGSQPAKQLTFVTPAMMGPQYFRDVASEVNAGSPPDPARMAETMRQHGMVPVAPPAH